MLIQQQHSNLILETNFFILEKAKENVLDVLQKNCDSIVNLFCFDKM